MCYHRLFFFPPNSENENCAIIRVTSCATIIVTDYLQDGADPHVPLLGVAGTEHAATLRRDNLGGWEAGRQAHRQKAQRDFPSVDESE
jgi:hypothetical protein